MKRIEFIFVYERGILGYSNHQIETAWTPELGLIFKLPPYLGRRTQDHLLLAGFDVKIDRIYIQSRSQLKKACDVLAASTPNLRQIRFRPENAVDKIFPKKT